MTNLRSVLAMLAVAFTTTSCETEVVVRGKVSVSAAVAQMFSAEKQGRVVLQVRLQSVAGAKSIGGLCGGSAAVDLPFEFSSFGCASEGTVTAWVEPVAAGNTVPNPCGPHEERWGRPQPEQPVRTAQAMVFTGRTKCDDGGEMNGIDLVLE
jgi:hypothetical protein